MWSMETRTQRHRWCLHWRCRVRTAACARQLSGKLHVHRLSVCGCCCVAPSPLRLLPADASDRDDSGGTSSVMLLPFNEVSDADRDSDGLHDGLTTGSFIMMAFELEPRAGDRVHDMLPQGLDGIGTESIGQAPVASALVGHHASRHRGAPTPTQPGPSWTAGPQAQATTRIITSTCVVPAASAPAVPSRSPVDAAVHSGWLAPLCLQGLRSLAQEATPARLVVAPSVTTTRSNTAAAALTVGVGAGVPVCWGGDAFDSGIGMGLQWMTPPAAVQFTNDSEWEASRYAEFFYVSL
jgi:hypothetical protein